MSVDSRLRALSILERAAKETPCAQHKGGCGHPFYEHLAGGRCWFPRVLSVTYDKACRCKQFVDPE